jgi:hypothetical protein
MIVRLSEQRQNGFDVFDADDCRQKGIPVADFDKEHCIQEIAKVLRRLDGDYVAALLDVVKKRAWQ